MEKPRRMTRMERFHGVKPEESERTEGDSLRRMSRRERFHSAVESILSNEENKENGRKALNYYNLKKGQPEKSINHEKPLFHGYGATTLNKGELTKNPDRLNEDSAYLNPKAGVFAVFDGAGGVKGGYLASATARETLKDYINSNGNLKSREEITDLMKQINSTVMEKDGAGVTTGVIGQFFQNREGRRGLIFASIGDSRIYQERQGHIRQLTKDEGYNNVINNCLGRESCKVNQVGIIPVEEGDNFLFCSDGITGDFEKDFIPDAELASILHNSETPKDASEKLVHRATKIDDRTAIVVRV